MKEPTLHGLDRIYNHISQHHPYPLLLYSALCLATWAPNAYAIISINFTNAKPGFVDCNDRHGNNLTYHDFCSLVKNTTSSTECVDRQYRYVDDWINSTLVTNYDLVCERSDVIQNSKSVQMLGFFIAAIIQGIVCDKLGRRKAIVLFCTLSSVFFVLNGLAQSVSYVAFLTMQVLVITCANASGLAQFVYGMEMLGPRYRSFFGVLAQVYFSLGFMLLTPVALLVTTSPQIMYFGAILPLSVFAILPVMHESFRWQLSRGMQQEGMASLRHFLAACGGKLDDIRFDAEALIQPSIATSKITDIFKSGRLMRYSIQLAYIWFVTTITYYATAISESSGNLLADNVASALVEIAFLVPGGFILQAHWCRRRYFLATLFLISGLSALADAYFTYRELAKIAQMARLPGRGAITVVFAMLFVYTGEVYPTSIRATGLGFCSFCARVGGVLAPQMSRFMAAPWAQGVIIATLAFTSCLVSLVLKHTSGD